MLLINSKFLTVDISRKDTMHQFVPLPKPIRLVPIIVVFSLPLKTIFSELEAYTIF